MNLKNIDRILFMRDVRHCFQKKEFMLEFKPCILPSESFDYYGRKLIFEML